MRLKTLIKSIGQSLPGGVGDIEVKGITSDSRKVQDNFMFVAVKGRDFDGHNFIQQAVSRGAKAIVVDSSQLTATANPAFRYNGIPPQTEKGGKGGIDRGVAFIKVADTRQALAKLVARAYGNPCSKMKVVGITGTNGKTTISYLIEAILKSAQRNPAVIGTINYRFKDKVINAGNTTPGPEQLQALLAQMSKEGVDYAIIETSSHALDQARVEAIDFCAAIFTNLSADHLDYHHDLDSYFAAKSRLFTGLSRKSFAILNIDDAQTQKLIKLTKAGVVTYGLHNPADITAGDINFSLQGAEFCLDFSQANKKIFPTRLSRLKISTSLIGEYNIYNILAAVAFGLIQKIAPEIIKEAIKRFPGVPGRLERVPIKRDFFVFVDYAHTEEALRNVISSLRPLSKGRILVVFGCGGNRDRAKRPKMGGVVAELADLAIITTDNPRNEQPEEIINDIVAGINKRNFRVVVNRRQAIKEALSLAAKDDIILIAGKGHEACQIFQDKIIHFDDREVVGDVYTQRDNKSS